ncbi:MAG TPA: dihydrofolate reductase [Candidatus Paceibacterota bacterium]|nr:dihydrofolate reductase [Candidatus Paceibacterota bacterium]
MPLRGAGNMTKPQISIVVAVGRNKAGQHVIGTENQLLWRIKDDLKRFKELTLGHPVIMGRKTFESIVGTLGKALPGRTNIVITRDKDYKFEGAVVCHSLEEALEKAKEYDQEEIFIGGGTQIYQQAFPLVGKLYLTEIDDEKEGDAIFPPYEHLFTKKTFEESRTDPSGLRYRWVNRER